ncbi:MAG: hypothetical protein DRR16_21165 [Candidatus Parabeggiatoa sp. nov. 3]|nr:MAG: hypothetical protein DRR00_25535 [Gammaproteobacteria bacterium]RKZ60205.1 MAG: hypothetical protein DRQ99_22450 [Gammaproteobacteria bacterium]RKZ81856.1 MAG: hypothetical protein DRR16_21165 [Gammaproteobacteria bacterium]
MNGLTDEQVVMLLSSRQKGQNAAEEIFKRGSRLFDLLLAQEGDKDYFYGRLGNPYSATAMIMPLPPGFEIPGFNFKKELSEEDQEQTVTVEVVSLYLISAIYFGKLHFADNPLLVLRLPFGKQSVGNKQEYIIRGFHSAREWIKKFKKVGMESLRAQGEDPLKNANLEWW